MKGPSRMRTRPNRALDRAGKLPGAKKVNKAAAKVLSKVNEAQAVVARAQVTLADLTESLKLAEARIQELTTERDRLAAELRDYRNAVED